MDFIPFNSPAPSNRSSDVKQNSTAGVKGTSTGTNSKLAFGSPAIAFGSPAVAFGSPAVSFSSPAISPLGGPSKPNASPMKSFSPSPSNQQYTPNRHKGSTVSPFGSPALSKANSSPANSSFSPNNSKQQYTPGRHDTTRKTDSPLAGPAFGSPALSKANSSPANSPFSPNHSKQQYTPRRYNSTGSPHTYNNNSPNPRFQNYSPSAASPNDNSGRRHPYSNEGSRFKTPYQSSPGRGRGNGRGSFSGRVMKLLDKCGGVVSVRSVLGAVLVNIPLVFMLTIGNLSTYVISYCRFANGETTRKNEDIIRVLQFGAATGVLGGIMGSVVERRIKTRAATLVGSIIYVAGCVLSYFSIRQSFIAFVVTYGVLCECGYFWVYATCMQNAMQWVPRYTGTVSALVSGSSGIGALIFDLVMTAYVNPENVSPDYKAEDGNMYFTDERLLHRIPYSFLQLGAIYALLMGAGLLLMQEPHPTLSSGDQEDTECIISSPEGVDDIHSSKEMIEEEYTELQRVDSSGKNGQYGATVEMGDYNDSDLIEKSGCKKVNKVNDENDGILAALLTILKSRDAYIVWLYVFTLDTGQQFAINLYKVYGQTFIPDDMFLAVVGSVAGLCNSVSRLFWGVLMDKYSLEIALKVLAATFTFFSGTLALTRHLGRIAYLIWIGVMSGCFSGLWPLVCAASMQFFGNKNVTLTITFMETAMIIVACTGNELLLQVRGWFGWNSVFLFCTCLGTIAFIIGFLLSKGEHRQGDSITKADTDS